MAGRNEGTLQQRADDDRLNAPTVLQPPLESIGNMNRVRRQVAAEQLEEIQQREAVRVVTSIRDADAGGVVFSVSLRYIF